MQNNTLRSIITKTKSEQCIKYVMNLTEKMTNSLISKVESAITEEKQKQAFLDEDLKSAKEMYELIKERYDIHQVIIDEEQHTLDALVRFKTKTRETKLVKIYTQLSTTVHKIKKERKLIPWKKVCIEILQEEQKIYDLKTLLRLAIVRLDLKLIDEERQIQKVVYYLKHESEYKPTLEIFITDNKIGLRKWFDIVGVILPKYLDSFLNCQYSEIYHTYQKHT